MKQISPHPLWLGHAGDGRDFRQILNVGIDAVVQVAAEEPPLQLPRELIYCRFPLIDGNGNDAKLLHVAMATVASLIVGRVSTLICCGAGMSRSPAIAAGALSMAFHKSADDWLREIAELHGTDVVPGLWEDVKSSLK